MGRKLDKWQWRHNFPTWRHRQSFWTLFCFLLNFSYWSKYHVHITTDSRVMTISFFTAWKVSKYGVISCPNTGKYGPEITPYLGHFHAVKGLTRNPEIGNTLAWVLPNIWRLWWVRNTKSGTNVSNKMLLNAAKCQDYSFYCFWVIKRKETGEGGKFTPPPPHRRQIKGLKG